MKTLRFVKKKKKKKKKIIKLLLREPFEKVIFSLPEEFTTIVKVVVSFSASFGELMGNTGDRSLRFSKQYWASCDIARQLPLELTRTT